ncbi:MAG: TRAP transporter small permease subunit [Planktotalea sp.]|uniref:TRAP transporter small permease n=1 Tax=Planktotalea sp. TaxID=2029877 RepID=UPI003C709CC2
MQPAIRFFKTLSQLPMIVASIALFALMCLTFADVLMRSIFNAPIEAATELIRMGIALIVFAALPVLSARNGHIAVDLLDGPFQRFKLERWRDAAVALACAAMLWWPAGRVVDLAKRAKSYGDVTEYLEIPTYFVACFIAVMIYVTAAALVARALLHIFSPDSLRPHHG